MSFIEYGNLLLLGKEGMRAPHHSRVSGRSAAIQLLLGLAACSLLLVTWYSQHFYTTPKAKAHQQESYIVDSKAFAVRSQLKDVHAAPQQDEHWSCPLQFNRLTFEDIREFKSKPYILGGAQQPACSNCRVDKLWSHFCQFKSHGPTCNEWDQWRLLKELIERAEDGASSAREMLTMTPCDIFELIEGRTLWLIGDSLTQEFQRAMQCFFYEFWDLEDHDATMLTEDPAAREMLGVLGGWCIFMLRGTRICHLRSNFGEYLATAIFPHLPSLGATPSDIIVFNFGVWHNDEASLKGNLSRVVEYVGSHQSEMPFLIWREAAPQHFDTPLGEFGCDGCPEPRAPYQCMPQDGIKLNLRDELESVDPGKQVLLQGGWRNKITTPAMQRFGIPIVHIWNHSLLMWNHHYNFQVNNDCTHMCHPSSYQVWVSSFYQLLRSIQASLPSVSPV